MAKARRGGGGEDGVGLVLGFEDSHERSSGLLGSSKAT